MKLLTISVFLCIVSIIDSYPATKKTEIYLDDMVKSVDCESIGGTKPFDIYNSPYYIHPSNKICCPFEVQAASGESICINRTKVEQKCRAQGRGITSEPCAYCETCAKLACETCEGLRLIHGNCDHGLKCDGGNETSEGICVPENGPLQKEVGETCGGTLNCFGGCQNGLALCEEQKNGEPWRCVMKAKTRNFNEACGGAYGKVGRCKAALKCTADEDSFLSGNNITGTCFRAKQKICFKECSEQPHGTGHYACGSDGVWYLNNCFRKQRNCAVPVQDNKHPDWVKKIDDPAEILEVCGEEPTDPPIPDPLPAEADEEGPTEVEVESEIIETAEEAAEEEQETLGEATPAS